MYMTASRRKIDGKPYLKLNIHDFSQEDVPFLDSLEINQEDEDFPDCRYINIYSQEDFLSIRATILERYKVVKETGPHVFLEKK